MNKICIVGLGYVGMTLAMHAARNNYKVYGVEVSDKARKVLESKGIAAYKTLSDIETGIHFDIIRMNWSLEHVYSPNEYFEFIANRLATGAKAIITVPNYNGLLYRVDPECVEIPIHLYHFCKNDLFNYAKNIN